MKPDYPRDSAESKTWCRNTFNMIREGGTWGVPRSGLIFTKRDGKLVLTVAMPWTEGMPITEAKLREQQEWEFNLNRDHFGAAGIEVIKDAHVSKTT